MIGWEKKVRREKIFDDKTGGKIVFSIETYVLSEEGKSKKEKSSRQFVRCDNENCFRYVKDFFYLEGAIIMYNNETNILDFCHWDLVDLLWIYLLDATDKILKGKQDVSFWFPDQPIKFRIQVIPNYASHLLIYVDKKRVAVDRQEFIWAIINGAEAFFSIGVKSCSGELVATSYIQIEIIKRMKEIIIS